MKARIEAAMSERAEQMSLFIRELEAMRCQLEIMARKYG